MIGFAQRRALESLLEDDDAATRALVVQELIAQRRRNEALIRELARSGPPRTREAAVQVLRAWNCGLEDAPAPAGTCGAPCLQSWDELEKLCWLLAAMEYPGFQAEGYARTLDAWADRVREVSRNARTPESRAAALRGVLAGEIGLQGNHTRYYAPDNSYLHRVLETRLGIPLTLSLAYIFTARRAGWNAWGLNTPGHYLCAVEGAVLDPYGGGATVSPESLARRFGDSVEDCRRPDYHRATPVETAHRLLANLLNSYLKAGDQPRCRRIDAYLRILQENSA